MRDRGNSRVFARNGGVAPESRPQNPGTEVVAVAMNTWLEPELQRELREVVAPPEFWDRVQSARFSRRPERSHPRLLGRWRCPSF